MARTKQERSLSFKPKIQQFGPLSCQSLETIGLDHDEIEAVYLMDYLGQYQDACAEQMSVSRPTFSRIIKSARKKIADALIHGKSIQIRDMKKEYVIVLPSNDQENISKQIILARYFGFFQVTEAGHTHLKWIDNPIALEAQQVGLGLKNDDDAKGLAAGRIIPPLLGGANVVLVREIGDGLRRNIEGSGKVIQYIKTANIDNSINQLKEKS